MKGAQHSLCLPMLGPVYWIIHQYNRCLFFLSPRLCLIWSENLLMQCVPGSCETNLKLHIKIWCLSHSHTHTHTHIQRVWCLPFVKDGDNPPPPVMICLLMYLSRDQHLVLCAHRWEQSVFWTPKLKDEAMPVKQSTVRIISHKCCGFVPHADK